MDDIERVINVHTRKTSLDAVRRYFERFGNIVEIYPWTSGSARTHYFIEFDNAESVKRVKVDSHNMTFQYLSRNPDMVKRYRALVSGNTTSSRERKRPYEGGDTQRNVTSLGVDDSPNYAKKPRFSNTNSTYPRPELSPPYSHKNSVPHEANSYQSQWSSQRRTSDRASYHSSQTKSPDYIDYNSPTSGSSYCIPDNLYWISESPLHTKTAGTGIQSESVPYTYSNQTFLDSRFAHNEKPINQDQPQLKIPPSPISLVDMQSTQSIPSPASSYAAGEYNPSFPLLLPQVAPLSSTTKPCQFTGLSELTHLNNLNKNDATRTLASLKQTSFDLGEWMTAAATFRRNGLHAEALEITNALLGEMRSRGMKDSDMKPALLLAAQSRYSLALGSNQEESAGKREEKTTELFLAAIDGFHNVYGIDRTKANAIAISTDTRRRALNSIGRSDKENESPRTGTACSQYSPAKNTGVDTVINKELSALKKKHASTLTALQNAKADTQRAKEALNSEYKRQTDLQRRLDDLRQELRRTQGDADAMYKKMQRESEARRAAETRLAEEIEAAQRRETELKDKTTKQLMQRLAKTFERVSESPSRMRELTNTMVECKEETRNPEL